MMKQRLNGKNYFCSHKWDKELFAPYFKMNHPTKAYVTLTPRCNHRCLMCNFHDMHGQGLELSRLKDAFNQMAGLGISSVQLSGGEALLRDDFAEIARAARSAGIANITLASNGSLLAREKTARLVGELNLAVSISFHGRSSHDAITQVPGSADRVLKSIDLLNRYAPDSPINLAFVINRLNAEELDYTLEMCRQSGIGLGIGLLDQNLYFFKGSKAPDLGISDPARIDRVIESLYRGVKEGGLLLWPRNIVFAERYLRNQPIDSPCPLPLDYISVDWDGSVRPGCWPLGIAGNIQKNPLQEIINSDAYLDLAHRAFIRDCPGCTCGYRTMSAYYIPYILQEEQWYRGQCPEHKGVF